MATEATQEEPLTAATAVRDRRVRVRHAQQLRSFCQQGAGELDQVWWIGTVRDISESGIGLIVPHHFDDGMILTLELENHSQSESRTVQVSVIHVTAQGRGRWLVGCAFTRPITEAELRSLLG